MADLSVRIGSLTLTNPFLAASRLLRLRRRIRRRRRSLESLGGVVVKGLFLNEREGHPPPRIVETPAGMLNAIGLQGIGVHRFVAEKLPELRRLGATVIVNICGIDASTSTRRCRASCRMPRASPRIELNISCPNIKEGGIQFGCSLTGHLRRGRAPSARSRRLPIIPKLTPNVTDVASFARAAEEAGADAVSLVNTFLAMAIDVETRRPKLSNVMGGLSGPAIRPIAVRMVCECRAGGEDARSSAWAASPTRRRCARVHHRRRDRGAGRHRELRRPVHLAEADRRPRRLPRPPRHRAVSPIWSGTLELHRARSTRMNRILVALDVDTAAPRRARWRTAARRRRRLQDRQPAVHGRGPGDRPGARRPRRPRVPRPEVPRHPEHRRRRGGVRRRPWACGWSTSTPRRARHDGAAARAPPTRPRRGRPGARRSSSPSRC